MQIAHRLKVWGYTNKVRLRGLNLACGGRLCLCSRDFQSPGIFAKLGCTPVCLTISSILQGETDISQLIGKITKIVQPYHPEFQEYFDKAAVSLESLDLDEGLNPGETNSVGYTLKTLGAGFWALQHGESYQDGILRIIHEGGDADTNAAVAGALLGAKFGYSNIPLRWVEGLVYRQELDGKVDRLMDLI